MRATIRCSYPGTSLEPTEVTFVRPGAPELGDTPEAVHAYITGLLRSGVEEFGLPAVGEKWPFAFARETTVRWPTRSSCTASRRTRPRPTSTTSSWSSGVRASGFACRLRPTRWPPPRYAEFGSESSKGPGGPCTTLRLDQLDHRHGRHVGLAELDREDPVARDVEDGGGAREVDPAVESPVAVDHPPSLGPLAR